MRSASRDGQRHRVAVAEWWEDDDTAIDICSELKQLGYEPIRFLASTRIPPAVDTVVTYAPWGPLLNVLRQVLEVPIASRPVMVHWNLENPADISIPWSILSRLASVRTWLSRLGRNEAIGKWPLLSKRVISPLDRRMLKLRYLGDYLYATRHGCLDVLAETSQMFADLYAYHQMPAFYVPWGTAPGHFDRLDLSRDIDVLWIGKRRTRRRSNHIDRVRRELALHGVNLHVVDGIENPLVYGPARTELLNRAKIALQIMSVWYDNSFHMRFHVVAGNRCMVISEHLPPHYREYQPGIHYVSTDLGAITEAVLYHLRHEEARRTIAENAYQLVTTEMTFNTSVRKLMDLAAKVR